MFYKTKWRCLEKQTYEKTVGKLFTRRRQPLLRIWQRQQFASISIKNAITKKLFSFFSQRFVTTVHLVRNNGLDS